MNVRATVVVAASLLALSLLVPVSTARALADVPSYTVTDLGPIAAQAINDRGQIAGTAALPEGILAILREPDGTVINLGALQGDSSSVAYGLNNLGWVVGVSGLDHAFVYRDGVMSDLGTLPGGVRAFAAAINDAGQAVGFVAFPERFHAVLYQDGDVIDLDDPEEPGGSSAWAINAQGQIVGVSAGQVSLWEDGTLTRLGPGRATGINAQEWIVGVSVDHAVLYQERVPIDLGVLPGDRFSQANGVNEAGQVVGASSAGVREPSRAFLWQADTGILDLNDLIPANAGWQLETAVGINQAGQIVGRGAPAGGTSRAFLLTPATRW